MLVPIKKGLKTLGVNALEKLRGCELQYNNTTSPA